MCIVAYIIKLTYNFKEQDRQVYGSLNQFHIYSLHSTDHKHT